MKNAIIILCYNDCDTSIHYIRNIIDYDLINYLVVVDNGSNEDKRKCLEQRLNEIKSNKIVYIANEKNVGYAKGNNIGIQYAINTLMADTIIVSNTDVFFTEKALRICIQFLDEHNNAGLVSPTMKNPKGEVCLSAWKLPTFTQMLWNSVFVLQKIYNPQSYTNVSGKSTRVDVLPGSFLIGKAKVWKDVNGFDEDTFLYGEESLLAYKLKKKGYYNYLLNDVTYIHDHSTIINNNISSFYKKMKFLYDANKVYNNKCLKTNHIQNALYFIVFYINVGMVYLYRLIFK